MSTITSNRIPMYGCSNYFCRFLLLLVCTSFIGPKLWAVSSTEKVSDIRVLVDVSGSMKKNDPRNLRKPAMDLLLQLFPKDSKAGVWTFGRYVNMLINHDTVSNKWRDGAMQQTRLINSVALHTNIGLALEKANYDADINRFPSTQHYNKAVILLTDGVVDIDSNPSVNDAERQRILDEILPAYKRAGIKIHSVALSTNADAELLETLSEATGGLFAVAEDAEDLNKIFLRAFDNAAPADRVPLQDNRFVVDSSIEEFTALVFKRADSALTELRSPEGDSYNAKTVSNKVRWFSSTDYDLITIEQPVEGEWRINAELDPDNRVTVVSNLRLEIESLPNTIYDTQIHQLVANVSSGGELLSDKNFVDLLKVDFEVLQNGRSLSSNAIFPENPSRAVYRQTLNMFQHAGDYDLLVSVDGQTFKREREIAIQLKPGLLSEIKADNEDASLQVYVEAQDPDLLNAEVSVTARLTLPDATVQVTALEKINASSWEYKASDLASGDYQLALEAKGEIADKPFKLEIANQQFSLDVPGAPQVRPLVKEKVVEQDIAEPEPIAEPAPEVQNVEVPAEAEIEEAKSMPRWILYVALGLGNVVLLAGLFVAYKKLVADDGVALEPTEPEAKKDSQSAGKEKAGEEDAPEEAVIEESAENNDSDSQQNEGESVDLAENEAVDSKEIETPDKSANEQLTEEPEDSEEGEIDVALDLDAMLDVDDSEVAPVENEAQETDALDEELDAMLAELDDDTNETGAEEDQASQAEESEAKDNSEDAVADEEEVDVSLDLDEEFDLSTDLEEESKEQNKSQNKEQK